MRTNKTKGTPLIYHYLKRYQEDPKSRVFAPLSEAYRKAGLLDEAIEICRDGLRIHPHFVGGRVALARALFDKGEYDEVVKELEPLILDTPDNLVAQKLLAESYLILGRIAQSLVAYKVLLFFMPDDDEIARLVSEIENKAYEDGVLVLQKESPKAQPMYAVRGAGEAISGDPDIRKKEWIQKVEKLQSLLQKVQNYRTA